MIRSLPLAVLTPPKRETRQEPGLDIHREQLNLRPAVAITVALAVRVATWLFVRLLPFQVLSAADCRSFGRKPARMRRGTKSVPLTPPLLLA